MLVGLEKERKQKQCGVDLVIQCDVFSFEVVLLLDLVVGQKVGQIVIGGCGQVGVNFWQQQGGVKVRCWVCDYCYVNGVQYCVVVFVQG